MNIDNFIIILNILKKESKNWNAPAFNVAKKRVRRTPFTTLIGTVISARTKDEITLKASDKLFQLADNPQNMIKLSEDLISKTIYPAGFYKKKSKTILEISHFLIVNFNGVVPNNMKDLLSIKGVGNKIANIVLETSFNQPAIAVDSHLHRVVNRLEFVKTNNPNNTEKELKNKIPIEYWKGLNILLVAFGQVICKPITPLCLDCKISDFCKNCKM